MTMTTGIRRIIVYNHLLNYFRCCSSIGTRLTQLISLESSHDVDTIGTREILSIISPGRDMNKRAYLSDRLLGVLGILETGSKWRLGWLKITFSMSMMVFIVVAESYELVQISNDFGHFNDVLSYVLLGVMSLTKYSTLIYYRKRIRDLREKINNDKINGGTSQGDDLLIDNYDRAGLNLSKAVTYIMFGFGTGVVLKSLLDIRPGHRPPLPVIEMSYPFSIDSTGIFVIVYIQQFVLSYISAALLAATNAWVIFLTYHACGHYCVLHNYLERIAEDEDSAGCQPMDTGERIAKCVRLHQNICKMTEDIEDFYTLPNLVHFLVSAVAISTSGYVISTMHTDLEQLVEHVCMISAQFIQLFLTNWCGQLIADKSFGVSLAVYRSNYYKLEVRYQQDLEIISMRAQRPIYLTAGKFYNLSLESMANIIKASMSCFAMFATVDSSFAEDEA